MIAWDSRDAIFVAAIVCAVIVRAANGRAAIVRAANSRAAMGRVAGHAVVGRAHHCAGINAGGVLPSIAA